MSRSEGAPTAFADRGARAARRENTIEAFSHALALGATGLESDAWLTADGQVVLDHDGVVGPPWRRRPMAGQPRSELPAHIPTLEELYRSCGTSYELSLDVKDPAAFTEALRIARAAGAQKNLWVCEPTMALLRSWAEIAGSARLVNSTHLGDMPEGFPGRISELARVGVSALNLHGSEWTSERVRQVHEVGILAFGWDAQNEHHIRRLVNLGLDGIYSDHVDRLLDGIAQVSGSL